jgi:hypothetical protein
VGAEGLTESGGFDAIGGLGDDGDVGFGVEESSEAFAEHGVVVGEEDADGVGGVGGRSGAGCRSDAVKPQRFGAPTYNEDMTRWRLSSVRVILPLSFAILVGMTMTVVPVRCTRLTRDTPVVPPGATTDHLLKTSGSPDLVKGDEWVYWHKRRFYYESLWHWAILSKPSCVSDAGVVYTIRDGSVAHTQPRTVYTVGPFQILCP